MLVRLYKCTSWNDQETNSHSKPFIRDLSIFCLSYTEMLDLVWLSFFLFIFSTFLFLHINSSSPSFPSSYSFHLPFMPHLISFSERVRFPMGCQQILPHHYTEAGPMPYLSCLGWAKFLLFIGNGLQKARSFIRDRPWSNCQWPQKLPKSLIATYFQGA